MSGPDGETIAVEADHRRHAVVENTIRDLKYGVGLNHMPWGALQGQRRLVGIQRHGPQHGPWTSRIGLGENPTDTLRRRYSRCRGL